MAASLASTTASVYSKTINRTLGLEEALKALDKVEKGIDFDKLVEEAKAAAARRAEGAGATGAAPARAVDPYQQAEAVRVALAQTRAELLTGAGRSDEALKVVDNTLGTIRPDGPAARTLRTARARMVIGGKAAPALVVERSIGEFKGLDAYKGKIVLLKFYAHW
jgi:hypothetical protein